MRSAIPFALLSILLIPPAPAQAEGGGAVSGPTVGKSAPSHTADAEVGVPQAQRPSLANGDIAPGGGTNVPAAKGIETSTSAQGGQAESSRNGALSTPADSSRQKPKHHKKPDSQAGS